MRYAIIILTVLTGIFTGCGDADLLPKERAERLAVQANEALDQKRFEEAERLLSECIDIAAAEGNDAKLAEHYATLSVAQTSAGKIAPALETLAALRDLYRSAADRTAELHTMFEMAKLRFRLGDTDESLRLLQEAYANAAVFRLDRLQALAGLEAGTVQNLLGRHERAVTYLAVAAQYFTAASDTPRIIETYIQQIAAQAALGRTDAAYSVFQKGESIFAASASAPGRPAFYRAVGDAFAQAGDGSFARANYLQAINTLNQNNAPQGSQESILALLRLGELYFTHFSFPEAQQYFVAAYNVAKSGGDEYLQAYLLTRISDCLSKVSVYRNAKDGLIRSGQLYEQAHTLFARFGFGFGEAVTMHRLGLLKELSGDEGAAITFYKRAFEKYIDNTIPPVHCLLPVPAELLVTDAARPYDPGVWFTERLVGLLVKFQRNQEALMYHEMMRSASLQHQLRGMTLNFRDPGRRSRYAAFVGGMLEKQRLQLELFHLTSHNRNYAAKLQERLKYIRSKVEADAVTLMREYPVFSYIGFSQQSLRQMIDTKVPAGTMVVDYAIVQQDVWAFIIRSGEPVQSVRLSSFATTVRSMMDRFHDGVSRASVPRASLTELAADLNALLLRPLERWQAQRIVVIPPAGYESFPFHALRDPERLSNDARIITYLPHLAMINSTAQPPRFINSVVTVGYTPDFRWGLEFELRDTRSFFRNTSVLVNQSATRQKLENALGEILQLSSQFRRSAEGDLTFTLSDGTVSKSGVSIPVAALANVHPFQIVYLSDVQVTANTLSPLHAVIWLLNGSAAVVMNPYPITPAVSKMFGEQFYSSLSVELDPSPAYQKAVTYLGKKREAREGFAGASYLYYGVR